MPIILPDGIPTRHTLDAEGVGVLRGAPDDAAGARPLRVALVNLMPRKTTTELQIARLLGGTPRTVALTLVVPDRYVSSTTPEFYLGAFYRRWRDIRDSAYDALIVTGAPVECIPFEAVTYWPELTQIFDWATRNVRRSYYICWAAQAALYHFHGVPKHRLPSKRFGVFRQTILRSGNPLFEGLARSFPVPVSRHTETRREDLPLDRGLTVLAASRQSGLCMVEDTNRRALCMFNHLEYDADTLAEEFQRDRNEGAAIAVPENYYPSDDPTRPPLNTWRPFARRIFRNWLRGAVPAEDQAPEAYSAA
jgi:homoserine O-succinyltransferase/O-acetyltransferase